jgi:hypothetical protein
MNTELFYIDETNTVHLNKYRFIVRDYKTTEKQEYTDNTYYLNSESAHEWEVNVIPKHQLLELVKKEELDASEYTWMDGIQLQTENHIKELEEIAGYGSLEAYQASLPEATDTFKLDTDYRISKLELGL